MNNTTFIIGIVIPKDSKKLKRVYKTFIRKNINNLKNLDADGKMFNKDGRFVELKGSSMDKSTKLNFIQFFCQNNLFEVRYIILDNNVLEERFINVILAPVSCFSSTATLNNISASAG